MAIKIEEMYADLYSEYSICEKAKLLKSIPETWNTTGEEQHWQVQNGEQWSLSPKWLSFVGCEYSTFDKTLSCGASMQGMQVSTKM